LKTIKCFGSSKKMTYSYFGSPSNSEQKIQPAIRYPAFGLAGYPAKSVSGAFLINSIAYLPSEI
jgi:hypothetical protein